ncbi:hypothetical protein EYZ11_006767 [Aspergillus tanneri]|uniref:gamma-glutamylcyclotransferase n=1 Tax=Aspergillus tanneri TaxID=1220188 RepID=A0A4S3JEN5_9EURO|nr:uncharacterized protein ATNIH1004_006978 [Aspergillus tanneri]KAA8645559.1 hypothetical protein ATNIH1004_006978 [Aspergillus tanneri]THC93759.1 hypothetical protein EYZ11_006767 [Aspergillus tanneri]
MHLENTDDNTPVPSPITVTATTQLPNCETNLRVLYFAYGSNLSFTQMRMRCRHNPDLSSRPVAIARLDHWRWLICQYGYANVVPPAGLRVGKQIDEGDAVPVSGEEDTVYGVLYEMDEADETLLDGYESVDEEAPPSRQTDKIPLAVRPREQANGSYNKWYVSATVTEWLDEEQRRRRQDEPETTILVYVDEERIRVGPPRDEYIPRMHRAICEAETLGFPKKWVDEVMVKFIPSN